MDLVNSLSPSLDIREVQKTFIEYHLELTADPMVMQLLPPDLALKVQSAPQFSTAEELAVKYIHGSEPLRAALRAFVARCRSKPIMESHTSDLSLFDDRMPAVSRRFVGRRDELRQITENLTSYKPSSIVVRGVYGIGKTTLARQVIAHSNIEELYDIAWVPCADIRTLDDLDKRLGPLRYARRPGARSPTWFDRIIAALPGPSASRPETPPKRLLIVLDRIDTLAGVHRYDFVLSDFLAKLEQHRGLMAPRLLITLDGSHDLGIMPVNIELRPLYFEDAETFFTSFEFTSRWRGQRGLWNLVRRFAGHPLALAIAARAAPKDGNIETYLILLQRQHRPGEDVLDVALRLLLLDSSLQHPKTKEILQLVAYWPSWLCPQDVICTVLELPDVHAVTELADPASKTGLMRCFCAADGLNSIVLASYEMLEPFKDRLRRLYPLSVDHLAAVRRLVFGKAFRDPQWAPAESVFRRFLKLDKIFEEAFESPDTEVVISASDTVLSVPRQYLCWDPISSDHWTHLQAPEITHQLLTSTLQRAYDSAERLQDSHRLQLLSLLVLEEEANTLWSSRIYYPWPLSKQAAKLRTGLESWLARISDTARHAVHKCCYLLAVCSSWDAESASHDERPSFLRQALQYLDTADRKPESDSTQDYQLYWYLAAPWEILVGRLQTEALRLHLLMQLCEPGRAHDAYCAILAALDDAQGSGLEIGHVEFLVRLDVAAVFAAYGALAYAGDVLDVSLRKLPDCNSAQHESSISPWHTGPALILLRHYLATHKDAQHWRERRIRSIRSLSTDMYRHVDHHETRLRPCPPDAARCPVLAEEAYLRFSATGETASLYRVWLGTLCCWIPRIAELDVELLCSATVEAIDLISPACDWLPTARLLSPLKKLLPRPRIEHSASYRHSVAAIDGLASADFSKAQSAFLSLQETFLDDLPDLKDDPEFPPIFDNAELFPAAIRLSVWNDLFSALTEDCSRRASQTPLLTQGADANHDGLSEEPVIVTRQDILLTYIQVAVWVLVWVVSCLPDVVRAAA